jgi:hypothetical protein|tara:strand:+ start:32191 stop:32373 length:183 start_codon:yes stop_codon:yes gene_type:complete
MCIICIDLVKGSIRTKDALNNMFENIDSLDDKHVERILDLIEAMKKKEIENEEETILPHS